MDPISMAMSAVGLGMQIYGGLSGASVSSQEAKVSQDEAAQEQNINNAKQQAMELQSRRTNVQSMRNAQVAQATATASATSQGAQFGSGLQGGLSQIQAQTYFNMQGVNDATQTGRQINTYNQAISSDKEQMAALGGQAATDQAWSSLGGAMMKSGPMIGQMAKGFGSGSIGTFSNGGNDGAAPTWG